MLRASVAAARGVALAPRTASIPWQAAGVRFATTNISQFNTPERREEALRKSVEARKARADFKAHISAGTLLPGVALEKACNDAVLAKMPVKQFLNSVPSFGPKRTAEIISQCEIADNRKLSGLGPRQKEKLAEFLEAHKDRIATAVQTSKTMSAKAKASGLKPGAKAGAKA